MRKKTLGIGDIAKRLDISVTTVSFILNGKAEEKRISSKLTQKVLKLVKELGYVPNHLAKSLRTGKTNIIGLIVEDISNPFFANVARHIEEEANKRGYKIFYCSSESDPVKTKELIKVFRERQVQGYIITPSKGIEDEIQSLLNDEAHVILFDRYLTDIDTNYVVVDNAGGTYQAITHLINEGYKNIAFVTLISDQTQMKGRLEGYKQALKEHNRKSFIKKVQFHENSETLVHELASFLESKPEIDAVFFATNYLGISGLEALNRLHYKIPGDIGVVSFDDHDLFRLYSPSITVVAQPVEEMSKKIINILLEHLDDNVGLGGYRHFILQPSLIIRNSSRKNHQLAV